MPAGRRKALTLARHPAEPLDELPSGRVNCPGNEAAGRAVSCARRSHAFGGASENQIRDASAIRLTRGRPKLASRSDGVGDATVEPSVASGPSAWATSRLSQTCDELVGALGSPSMATGSPTDRRSQLVIRTNSRDAIGKLNWPVGSIESPAGKALERMTRRHVRAGKVRWRDGNVGRPKNTDENSRRELLGVRS